jgi:NADH dehydrogenase (ubiquinone) 1 alpha/beta subcomplex 1
VDSSKVSGSTKFADLDLDSLDVVEVVLAIEEEFALEIPDVRKEDSDFFQRKLDD